MEGIKIEVTGNIARVIERPEKITSGTIGMPVEFAFDQPWDGLTKMAVFRAGCLVIDVINPGDGLVVPWEVLENPGPWLSVGVYGINDDGTIAIPTIWANIGVIFEGVDPDGDPSVDPTLPIWKEIINYIDTNGSSGGSGKSAYEIAVENGFKGTEEEWLASLKGEKGDPGQSGVYVGTGDMPADCNVQIDPDGEPLSGDQLLPEVTDTDNGKFLRVADGVWSAVTVDSAEGASF